MRGLVIKNTGSWYIVKTDDGQLVECKIKGNFRLKGIRSTNPIAVGDIVEIDKPIQNSQQTAALITSIHDRRNYIIRKSINLSKQSHIIATNVDKAFLVVTVSHPETSTTFIDRFLASAEAYRIPVVLLFNKTDLLTDEELHYQQMMMELYRHIGYQCISVSAITGKGITEIKQLLNGCISVFSGHSGVGKSSILNHFIEGRTLKTAALSEAHDAGMHTTTFSEMIQINDSDTYIIDTPGIKGFGTFDIEKEELTSYFKEIFEFSQHCRFSNCTHTHEPGCAVLKALEEHLIAQSRYNSYLSMLGDKDEDRYRASN
ncbi:MAG: ribosome small subunit-dependent GTPase A [Prevotellaceae bacterium]|nr:ribosome small subunit-dependent GTPase A [Prevotellaceae bacterium]